NPTRRSQKSLARVRSFGVRNDLLRPWIYFPADLAITVTLWRSVSHLFFGIRRGFLAATLRGYLEFIVRLPLALVHRRPISRSAALKYLRVRQKPQSLRFHE